MVLALEQALVMSEKPGVVIRRQPQAGVVPGVVEEVCDVLEWVERPLLDPGYVG